MSLLMDALTKAEEEKKRAQVAASQSADSTDSVREPDSVDPGQGQDVPEAVLGPLADRSEEPTIEASKQQNSMELTLEPLPPERRAAAEERRPDRDPKSKTSALSETVPSSLRGQSNAGPRVRVAGASTGGAASPGPGDDSAIDQGRVLPEQTPSYPRAGSGNFEFGDLTTRVTANTVFEARGSADRSGVLRLGGLVLGSILAALAGIGLYFELNLPGPQSLAPQSGLTLASLPKPQPTLIAAAPAVVVPTAVPMPTATPVPLPTQAPTPLPSLAPSPAPTTLPLDLTPTALPNPSVAKPDPVEPTTPELARTNRDTNVQQPLYSLQRSTIEVLHGTATTTLDTLIQEAYSAFRVGESQRAETLYREALQRTPANRDALLGLGAINVQRGMRDRAYEYYRRVLELDPKDAVASAALFSLGGGADREISEERLQGLLEHNANTPELQFSLGNVYARRGRWADAQQAYFSAFSADSGNADYAFNLAVSLERLGQQKAALGYYEKALALARVRPAGFNTAQASARVNALTRLIGG
jgi:Flp pilus assembly protein TadD